MKKAVVIYDSRFGNTEKIARAGAGRVEVYDLNGNLLARFALSLNSIFTVQDLDKIKGYVEAPIPESPRGS